MKTTSILLLTILLLLICNACETGNYSASPTDKARHELSTYIYDGNVQFEDYKKLSFSCLFKNDTVVQGKFMNGTSFTRWIGFFDVKVQGVKYSNIKKMGVLVYQKHAQIDNCPTCEINLPPGTTDTLVIATDTIYFTL